MTGCAGFIGSHVTESLLGDGFEVLGVDCLTDNYARDQKLRNIRRAQSWDGFKLVSSDLAAMDLRNLVESCDLIFHFAAEPGVRESWNGRFEAYVRNNVYATHELLEALRGCPDKRLVYASSSSVYGESESLPTTEGTLQRPSSPYGVTKLAAENLCEVYHRALGMNVVSLRLFSVYGPRQRPDMACHVFARALLLGTPLHVYGDGHQTRDLTFVADVVRAARLASECPGAAGRVYNVGGGSAVSVRAVIAELTDLAGSKPEVVYAPRASGDVRNTKADTSRAREELGFVAMTALRDGLESQWDWLCGDRREREA